MFFRLHGCAGYPCSFWCSTGKRTFVSHIQTPKCFKATLFSSYMHHSISLLSSFLNLKMNVTFLFVFVFSEEAAWPWGYLTQCEKKGHMRAPRPKSARAFVIGLKNLESYISNHIRKAMSPYALMRRLIWAVHTWHLYTRYFINLQMAHHFLQDCMSAQWRLRSARRLIGLRCPPEGALDHWLPIECSTKALIRLRECSGWFESSLGAYAILEEMLRPGLNYASPKMDVLCYLKSHSHQKINVGSHYYWSLVKILIYLIWLA